MIHSRVCQPASMSSLRAAPFAMTSLICRTRTVRVCATAQDRQLSKNSAKVVFKLPMHVSYGQSVNIVGSVAELGSWDPQNALPMTWSDKDVWTSELQLPSGSDVQYKYIIKNKRDTTTIKWQGGDNLTVQVPPCASVAEICDSWEAGRGSIKVSSLEQGSVVEAPALPVVEEVKDVMTPVIAEQEITSAEQGNVIPAPAVPVVEDVKLEITPVIAEQEEVSPVPEITEEPEKAADVVQALVEAVQAVEETTSNIVPGPVSKTPAAAKAAIRTAAAAVTAATSDATSSGDLAGPAVGAAAPSNKKQKKKGGNGKFSSK